MYIMLILFGIEAGQYFLTVFLCVKLKKSVSKEQSMPVERTESKADEVLEDRDEELSLRVRQMNLLLLAFTLNFVIGLFEAVFIVVPNNAITC